MQTSGETGAKLAAMIKKAIKDGKMTNEEYAEIMRLAEEDGVIDRQEQSLLNQLQAMIADGTVVRGS